jgi:hypothetical protein
LSSSEAGLFSQKNTWCNKGFLAAALTVPVLASKPAEAIKLRLFIDLDFVSIYKIKALIANKSPQIL